MIPVKFFHSNMGGAPVISNNWGDVTAALDAVLVNGFNLKTATSLTRTGSTATITFPTTHGFEVYQVIEVAGCNEAGYNGEFRVASVTSNTLTYEVAGTPATPATTGGTITCKAAPLGFEIAFTGTNKRAYRSKNVVSLKHILRVDDSLPTGYTTTWAKFARVGIAEGMSDIDTYVGVRAPYDPDFPTKNDVPSGTGATGVFGWYRWFYAKGSAADTSGDNGAYARAWNIVGDDRGFFLNIPPGQTSNQRTVYFFGEFNSFKAGDGYCTGLSAADYYGVAQTSYNNYPIYGHYPGRSHEVTGKVLLRNYTQIGNYTRFGPFSLNDNNGQNYSGYNSWFPYPNGADLALLLHPVYIREEYNSTVRGTWPGVYWVHQNQPMGHNTMIDNVLGYPGRKFLYLQHGAVESNGNQGAYCFDITGPWR